MAHQTVALVDCDAFYCSCETIFQPGLRGKPVGVLSNNDGNLISRNRACKQLCTTRIKGVTPTGSERRKMGTLVRIQCVTEEEIGGHSSFLKRA
jgi:nucleotidyltransferase/DNA polymerase involved in DNA repair